MDPETLVRLKVEMEFGVRLDGETMPLATLNDEKQPRVIASLHRGGELLLFREDVPEHLRAALRRLGARRVCEDEAAVRAVFAGDPVVRIWRIRWYHFERAPEPGNYLDVMREGNRFVVRVDGELAAWAVSERDHPAAEEVSVETAEPYRRRGYARQVCSAWAADVLARGKVAYYAHNQTNLASAAVARSLGVSWLSDEVEYD